MEAEAVMVQVVGAVMVGEVLLAVEEVAVGGADAVVAVAEVHKNVVSCSKQRAPATL